MQSLALFGGPLAPFLGDLADRCVTRAWHIADYPVESHPSVLTLFVILVQEVWEELSLVVDNHYVSGV